MLQQDYQSKGTEIKYNSFTHILFFSLNFTHKKLTLVSNAHKQKTHTKKVQMYHNRKTYKFFHKKNGHTHHKIHKT